MTVETAASQLHPFRAWRSRIRSAAVVLLVIVAVLCTSPLHLPLNNPNEGVRVFAAKALVEHGTFAIDQVTQQWGYIDDKARHNGKLYSSKAPLVSLLAAAAYAVIHPLSGDLARPALTRLCRVAGDILPSLFLVLLLWRSLRRTMKDSFLIDVGVVGIVLGTGVLASLHVLSGHALAALGPAVVLALCLEPDEGRRRRPLLVGALLGMAVGAEYPAALAAPPLVAFFVLRSQQRRRSLALAVLGAFLALVPVLIAHTAMFGAPWRTGYSFLENPGYRPLVEGTLFGIGIPDVSVLGHVLFSPAMGLFFFSPFLLVGVGFVLWGLRQRRAEHELPLFALSVTSLVVLVAFCLFIAGFRGWRGGWSVGPRYISELCGTLGVAAIVGLNTLARHQQRLARGLGLALVTLSVVHAGIAGAFFPHLPDALGNPVYELVLPLVWRGFSPDSLPLHLGVSPGASARLCVGFLFLPLLAALARQRAQLWAPALVAGVVTASALWLFSAIPSADDDAVGREVRRMYDNWRPDAGNPWVAGLGANPAPADEARVLFAVDRGRFFSRLQLPSCAPRKRHAALFDTAGPRTNALRAAAAQVPVDALLVVSDELAPHMGAVATGPLIVSASDTARHLAAGLPCAGPVYLLLRPQEKRPRRLQEMENLSPPQSLAGGFQLLSLARP